MAHEDDIRFMRIALEEAEKGIGRTSPNPCVGAVIVKDGKEIARGYHKKAGTPHAEIHALNAAGDRARGATIYVTLEPCNHTGKTPPCSKAVAKAGISRVVVGMEDPNPLVNGSGIDYLRTQGAEVVSGILEEECIALNRPFIKKITTGLPWVVMKAGMSLDGRLSYQCNRSGWITGAESLQMVHQLRDQFDAIMVGRKTVLIDDPSLTTRLPGDKGRDPQRVVVDCSLSLPLTSKIFHLQSDASTFVVCSHQADSDKMSALLDMGVIVVPLSYPTDTYLPLRVLLSEIAKHGINSILVEGGATLHANMLKEHLYDEAFLFQAPCFIGDGGSPLITGMSSSKKEDCPYLNEISVKRLGADNLIHGMICYPVS